MKSRKISMINEHITQITMRLGAPRSDSHRPYIGFVAWKDSRRNVFFAHLT